MTKRTLASVLGVAVLVSVAAVLLDPFGSTDAPLGSVVTSGTDASVGEPIALEGADTPVRPVSPGERPPETPPVACEGDAVAAYRAWRDDWRERYDSAEGDGRLEDLDAALNADQLSSSGTSFPADSVAESAGEGAETGEPMTPGALDLPGDLPSHFEERFRRGLADRRVNVQVTVFEGMHRCAVAQSSVALLLAAVAESFDQETRPALRGLWFRCLEVFGQACNPVVFDRTLRAFSEALQGVGVLHASGAHLFRTQILSMSHCDGLSDAEVDRLFALWIELIRVTSERSVVLSLFTSIAAMFPYTPAVGRFILDTALGGRAFDEPLPFEAMEVLWAYSGDMTPDMIRSLLEQEPLLLDNYMGGVFGARSAFATYTLLSGRGGEWGAQRLLDEIFDPLSPLERPESPVSKAQLVFWLGQSEDFAWIRLQDLLAHDDELIRDAALMAIGEKAAAVDEAYVWLRQEALDVRRPKDAVKAILALRTCGRDDLAAFLMDMVFPIGTPEMRAQALAVYRLQPGADPELFARLTDANHEADPSVRQAAAMNHLLATKDLDATSQMLHGMIGDPDLDTRTGARLALSVLYRYSGDPAAADAVLPAVYDVDDWVASNLGQQSVEALLASFRSPEYGTHASDQAFIAGLLSDQAMSNLTADQAWLVQTLHEIASQLEQD